MVCRAVRGYRDAMPHLVWARRASAEPMGQERYEQAACDAIRATAPPGWDIDEIVVRSLRSAAPGQRRLPARLERTPFVMQRAIGRRLYPRADLVHRWDVRLPPGRRDVVTLHDIAPLRFSDESAEPPQLRKSAHAALGVICPSRFSADEVTTVLGVRRCWVAPAGVDDRFREPASLTAAQRDGLGVPGRYVLHAGGSTKRKNLAALAGAWPAVHSAHPSVVLLLIGPVDDRRTSLFAGLAGVRLAGKVSDAVLPSIMADATALVLPSTYEGFGLPVLEAMAAGTPVVASQCASLPEVVGDAGLLVEPVAAAIAEALIAVVGDSQLAARLREKGLHHSAPYTWRRTAEIYLEVYREVLGL
jgi:glycosyltransferase involved in cell wall biosynthesis